MKYVLPLLLIAFSGFAAEPPVVKSKAAKELLKHPAFQIALKAAPELGKLLMELDQHAAEAPREKVVGKYHRKDENEDVHGLVFLETGIREKYLNDKKSEIDPRLHAGPSQNKWRVVDGEIHVRSSRRFTDIFKLNPDNSLTQIGYQRTTGSRTNWPQEKWGTYKRVE